MLPGDIVTLSTIFKWPRIMAAPPILQCLPMIALPAMPVQPAITVCAPMRQLWAI